MQPTNWTRLNRDQANRVLNMLSDNRDAIVFSKEATEVSWRTLPFYSNYRLYRLINYATLPTFSLMYLSNEEEFITLDGTANPIYTINEKDPLSLSETSVIAYLDFFFANVQGSEGDIFLIKDPRKMSFMEHMDATQKQNVVNTFKPLKVSREGVAYKVSGTIYYGGGLIAVTILMTPDGKLSFQEQNMLLSGIPFHENPYDRRWLEG